MLPPTLGKSARGRCKERPSRSQLKEECMGSAGGCLCGAIRYELASEPFDGGWCHCRTCQLYGGAPAMAFACVPAGDVEWTSGIPKWVESSSFGQRAFCPECSTPLQVRVAHQPETIDFPVTTLDDPTVIAP